VFAGGRHGGRRIPLKQDKLDRGYRLLWREFANAGPEPVKILALAVPGGIKDICADDAFASPRPRSPPDPRVMDEIAARHGSPTPGPIRADGAHGGR
jgi:hypothetical protein